MRGSHARRRLREQWPAFERDSGDDPSGERGAGHGHHEQRSRRAPSPPAPPIMGRAPLSARQSCPLALDSPDGLGQAARAQRSAPGVPAIVKPAETALIQGGTAGRRPLRQRQRGDRRALGEDERGSRVANGHTAVADLQLARVAAGEQQPPERDDTAREWPISGPARRGEGTLDDQDPRVGVSVSRRRAGVTKARSACLAV